MSGDLLAVLNAARSQIGVTEMPPGSNLQQFGAWYSQQFGGSWNGQPWCAMFVCWALSQGNALDVEHFSYCPSGVDYYKAAGRWGSTPKPGAVVFYQWTEPVPQHVGIVESVNTDGSIVAIEGNTSVSSQDNGGCVMRRQRKVGIVGYGYPQYAEATTTPAPAPVLDQYPMVRYGMTGPAVVKLQELLGLPTSQVDGVFGPRTLGALQAFQGSRGLAADGVCGPLTWTALLKRVGPATPPAAPNPIVPRPQPVHVAVDGQLGPETVEALQQRLNAVQDSRLPIDGVFGPATRLALQRRLGVAADGVIGPQTVTALQQHTGTSPADGVWGPDTTRHLQAALNAGTF